MRKSVEQLKAEQTLAMMIRNHSAEKAMRIVSTMTTYWRYAIAQRVTIAIIFAILYDIYDDFDEEMMNRLYDEYLAYHERFKNGDEKLFEMMRAVDDLMHGELLKENLFDAIKQKAEEDNE